jgi:hypothetical protein
VKSIKQLMGKAGGLGQIQSGFCNRAGQQSSQQAVFPAHVIAILLGSLSATFCIGGSFLFTAFLAIRPIGSVAVVILTHAVPAAAYRAVFAIR